MRALEAAIAVLGLGLAGALTGACSDPSVSIALDVQGELATYLDATDPVRTVTVRVVDADQALTGGWPRSPVSPGDAAAIAEAAAGATCAELRMARVPPEVVDAATVAKAVLDGDGDQLAGIPRLGRKLLLAQVTAEDGTLLGVGCRAVGDLDADATLTIPVTAAAHVVRLHDDVADSIEVIAVAPWDDTIVLGDRDVELDRFDRRGARPVRTATTDDEGVAHVPGLTAEGPAGPIDLLVRVDGNAAPLRLALWKRFTELGKLELTQPPAGHSRIPPGAVARWTQGIVGPAGPAAHWTAVAAFDDEAGDHRWVGFACEANDCLTRSDLDGMPAGVPLVWGGRLWLVAADGWHEVRPPGFIGDARPPAGPGPAIEAVRLEPCTAAGDELALVRRTPGAEYEIYDEPQLGEPHMLPPMTTLARRIGGGHVLDVVCIDAPAGLLRVLVVETEGGTLIAMPDRIEQNVALEKVSHLTDLVVADGGRPSRYALGAVLSETGPRARSFRFGTFTSGGQVDGVMVPVPIVDLPLAGSASALLAADLDGEGIPDDVIAALPASPGLRLQIVTDDVFAGESLSATSPRLAIGTRSTGRAVIAHANVDADPAEEVMVLADDGMIVYDDDPVR